MTNRFSYLFDARTPAGEALTLAHELYTMKRITVSERCAFERALRERAHAEAMQEFATDLQKPRE